MAIDFLVNWGGDPQQNKPREWDMRQNIRIYTMAILTLFFLESSWLWTCRILYCGYHATPWHCFLVRITLHHVAITADCCSKEQTCSSWPISRLKLSDENAELTRLVTVPCFLSMSPSGCHLQGKNSQMHSRSRRWTHHFERSRRGSKSEPHLSDHRRFFTFPNLCQNPSPYQIFLHTVNPIWVWIGATRILSMISFFPHSISWASVSRFGFNKFVQEVLPV
jgi:hypothetical protein